MAALSLHGIGYCPLETRIVNYKAGTQEEKGRAEKMRRPRNRKETREKSNTMYHYLSKNAEFLLKPQRYK